MGQCSLLLSLHRFQQAKRQCGPQPQTFSHAATKQGSGFMNSLVVTQSVRGWLASLTSWNTGSTICHHNSSPNCRDPFKPTNGPLTTKESSSVTFFFHDHPTTIPLIRRIFITSPAVIPGTCGFIPDRNGS